MALGNVLLVKHDKGYREYKWDTSIGTYARREQYVEQGDVADNVSIDEIAVGLMRSRVLPSDAMSLQVNPVDDADTPYLSHGIGDYVTVEGIETDESLRVVGMTVGFDVNGFPVFTPEVNTQRQIAEQRFQAWLNRVNNGLLKGSTFRASPAVVTAPPTEHPDYDEVRPFVVSGVLSTAPANSPVWRSPRSVYVGRVMASLRVAGSTATTVYVVVNGSAVAGATIPAGATVGSGTDGFVVNNGDVVSIQVASPGTDAEDLTVQMLATG